MKQCVYCKTDCETSATNCPNCQASEFKHKCDNCGNVHESAFCPDCGFGINETLTYCPKCGNKVLPEVRSRRYRDYIVKRGCDCGCYHDYV